MEITVLATILLIVTQTIANENKTTTGITDAKVKNNASILPRLSSNRLIKFEGQPSPNQINGVSDTNSEGKVTFENKPSSRPFRFEIDRNVPNRDSQKEFSKLPVEIREFGDQHPASNPDISQGYGIYKPGVFSNQNPNFDTTQPEVHPGFINTNPTASTNIREGQSGYGIFQDDKQIDQQVNRGQKKRRRRRRRKPKQLSGVGYGFAEPEGGGPRPGVPIRPSPYYPAPLLGGQPYRRPSHTRPSIAEEALVSITSALTSIARYDDLQCVPRLLCEVAGGQNLLTGSQGSLAGSGTAGSGLLNSIGNLQPLVTLLAAYNGISTSPLFVFGRAALLGMTSKGNAGTCRYAYPQCPTDPEKLVEYLNNHNGGFFRFFNNPQSYGHQNLEQFYGHLSGNYGLYQPQANFGQSGNPVQNFGTYPNPSNGGFGNQQYQSGAIGSNGINYPGLNYGYGFLKPEQFSGLYSNQSPSPEPGQNYGLYQGNYQNYGFNYPYQHEQYKNAIGKESEGGEIEKRIQNQPDIVYIGAGPASQADEHTKWTFPDSSRNEIAKTKQRFGRTVIFPGKEHNTQVYKESNADTAYVQQHMDSNKKAKGFNFPEIQSNRQYIDYYDYPPYTRILDNNNFKLDEQGFYVDSNERPDYHSQENIGNYENEDGVQIVYVIRGNGDPNMPEIVKLRPGQKLM